MKKAAPGIVHCLSILFGLSLCTGILMPADCLQARDLTLNQALDLALNHSSRGDIIKGRLEVAEQNYRAKRINFYLPEISLNGSLPSYNEDESYRFFGSAAEKSLFKTRTLGLDSYIGLKQSLITGGDLQIRANLTASDERYPNTNTGVFVYEDNRQGYFDFSYAQPLLKPSQSKYDLNNRRDDRELAVFAKVEEETALKTEVTEAYVGLMRARLALEVAQNNAKKAALQYDIDSSKFDDGIIAEEDFLESASAKLDAQLAQFEADTAVDEKRRELALLLDIKVTEPIETAEPEVVNHPDSAQRSAFEAEWEESVAISKAQYELEKSERAADYAAGSHGLTGDLALEYSFGRGTINRDMEDATFKENINTNSWGISLNLTYPIWDGGASSATVKAARFEADQARLEYQKATQTAQADIANLVNRLNVSYRRLDIVKKQIDLAENRLRIADSRLKDGQISELTWIENKVFYLETRDKYLEELTNYLTSRIELEGKFTS